MYVDFLAELSMDRTIGSWDCSTIFWTSLLTIGGGGGGGGWEIVLVLLINGVLTGSYKQFSRLTILCQGFCAELLRFFNFCHANARLEICQFPFSILLCWVTRVPFKSTCSSAKWYSLVTTGHKPVASRFPLCILLYKVYHYEFYLSFFFSLILSVGCADTRDHGISGT